MTTVTTPALAFLTVPNLVTCSEVTIEWTYNATTPPTYDYPLVVTNIGIDQSGNSRREYPLISRRQSTAVVNATLAAVNASAGRFDWPKVNIPQGWYRMDIYATAGVIPSNTFNVTNGLDVSCIAAALQPSTPPSSSTSHPTPASTDSPSSTNGPPVTTSLVMASSSVKWKAIVGGVVGGVAVIMIIIVLAVLWLCRRKTRTRNATPATMPRNKGQQFKGNHNQSDSTGAILPFGSKGNKGNSRQLSTSEDDFDSEKSAVADHDTAPKFPLTTPTRPSRRPASMMVTPSFESYESVQSRPSTSPAHPRQPPNRARRASRKPVPLYDPNEFPTPESNDIPLSGLPETVSDGTRKYYLIPDPHLGQRS
jgi:hypothetical protein